MTADRFLFLSLSIQLLWIIKLRGFYFIRIKGPNSDASSGIQLTSKIYDQGEFDMKITLNAKKKKLRPQEFTAYFKGRDT